MNAISTTYSDLSNNFPDSLDTITRVSDISADYISLATQYYEYKNAGNDTSAAALLTANPALSTMIINAAKINYFTDIAISLERFFKSDVEGYLEATFAYKGTYDAGTAYVKGNIIDYAGEGFICRVASSVGTAPTTHTTTTNWAIIAKQGIQGASGTGLAPRGAWSSATTYYINDCVAYNNTLWQCLLGNTNSEPTSSNSNWLSLLSLTGLVIVSSTQPTTQSVNNLWMKEV